MASSWGRVFSTGALIALFAFPRPSTPEALAGPAPPPAPKVLVSVDPPDGACASIEQGAMLHIFDTSDLPAGMHYVNDHTIVQAPDGRWHLFGIFHAEPMHDYLEVDLVHAVAEEHDPAQWKEGAFVPAPGAYRIALHADPRSARSTRGRRTWCAGTIAG